MTFRVFVRAGVCVFAGCLVGLSVTLSPVVRAQDPPSPPSGTSVPAESPPIPAPGVPAPPALDREAELEARIRQLEALVQQLSSRVESIQPAPAAPIAAPTPGVAPTATGSAAGSRPPAGPLAPGQGLPATPGPSADFNMPATLRREKLEAIFGPGFMVKSSDDEWVAQFHNLTQFDGRFYEQGGQDPVHDTFTFPRQWFIVSGRLTKPYEYFLSISEGFDTLNLLDVFLNVNYDPRLQFRIGRFKTPFTYEFFAEPIQGLINPERSLFFNNFALNRVPGMQVWGQLYDKRVDYATGIFNSNRGSLVDTQDGKDFVAYLSARPFQNIEDSPLRFFNFGGSMMTGQQNSVPTPRVFRTQVPLVGSTIVGVPFLALNDNVRLEGTHTFWSMHAAWYYKQLSLISEWQSGFQNYATNENRQARTNIPIQSFYVQAGYFLTGETVSNRGVVNPLKPFDLRPGKGRGPGAWELGGRYNYLDMGQDVFTNRLANPDLWTNRLWMTDLTVSWYWNQYIKWMFTWEHAEFGNPVLFNTNPVVRKQLTSDMFWLRMQIYF